MEMVLLLFFAFLNRTLNTKLGNFQMRRATLRAPVLNFCAHDRAFLINLCQHPSTWMNLRLV